MNLWKEDISVIVSGYTEQLQINACLSDFSVCTELKTDERDKILLQNIFNINCAV